MNKYRLICYKNNSRGVEKIISVKMFDTRQELQEYVAEMKAVPKPYKLPKNTIGYVTESTHY